MIVEDGTGVANANSYVTLDDANAYHTARGNAGWTGTDPEKEAALIRATDYIEQKYDGFWKGYRVNISQEMAWPRFDVSFEDSYLPSDEIPKCLRNAVCELALRALTETLSPDLARGGGIKREKVDVLEVEYFEGASGGTTRPVVQGLLRGLLKGTGFNVPVVRV